MIAAGPLWIIASVVLAASGWKLANPAPTARALRALVGPAGARRPATQGSWLWSARLLGAAEAAVALVVVGQGGKAAYVLAALYVAFAVTALRLRNRNVDCGCFGAASAKASWIHVVINMVAAVVAAWAGAVDVPGLRGALDDLPARGVAHLVLVPAGTAAMIALLTVLPSVREISRSRPVADQPVLFRLRSELT
ncbi:MAG: MauE/DoxX family redox-associated membrane protein [Acidimicrobiales bacterium]